MRRIPTLVLLAGAWYAALAATGAAGGEGTAAPGAVIERAIKAHGGAEALAKAAVCKRTDTGVLAQPGRDLKFTSEVVRSLPNRLKLSIKGDGLQTVIVLNGDKGWVQSGGPAVEMQPPYHREVREEAYVWWLATLVPLTKAGFALAALPEAKADGEPVVGVKVSRKGNLDANLYFSKKSDLLVKITRRVPEAGLLSNREYFFADYKSFGGIRLASKERVTSNGRRVSEYTVSDYRFPREIDASHFGRP